MNEELKAKIEAVKEALETKDKEVVAAVFEGIKSALKDNADVANDMLKHMSDVVGDDSLFETLVKRESFAKKVDSYADKRVTSGVATALEKFKTKELPSIIAEKLSTKEKELEAKYNPPTTAEQKAIAEANKRIEELERKNKLSVTRAVVTEAILKDNMPKEWIDMFVSEDTEASLAKVKSFAAEYQESLNERISAALKLKVKDTETSPISNTRGRNDDDDVITKGYLDELAKKARAYGKFEDQAAYVLAKQKYDAAKKLKN